MVSTNRLPLHTATGTSVQSTTTTAAMSMSMGGAIWVRCHGASWTVSRVEWRTTAATLGGTPTSLAGEDGVVEAVERARAGSVHERSVAEERDVVEAEIPNGSVYHTVRTERHDSANERTRKDVIPVMVFINGKSAANQASSENGGVDGDELPHGRVVVGPDLQFGIEVEVQEHETSEGSGSVTRWHGLKGIVDLLAVASADAAIKHDLPVAVCGVSTIRTTVFDAIVIATHGGQDVGGDQWLANSEEVRAESSDEPFDEHLEDSRGNESIKKADGGIVDVPERASSDLDNQEDNEGNEEGQ